jgi:hypothetical protein
MHRYIICGVDSLGDWFNVAFGVIVLSKEPILPYYRLILLILTALPPVKLWTLSVEKKFIIWEVTIY